MAQQHPVGQGFLIIENSQLHSDTPHSAGLLWTSDRPLPDNAQHSQKTDILAPSGFEPTIPTSEQPQTHGLDRAATGTGCSYPLEVK